MPLRAWGESAPAFLTAWFRLRRELGGPANLLFATLNKKDASLEDDVLNLLSVAEGYHRLRFDEPPYLDLGIDHQTISRAVNLTYRGREFMGSRVTRDGRSLIDQDRAPRDASRQRVCVEPERVSFGKNGSFRNDLLACAHVFRCRSHAATTPRRACTT